MGEIRDAILKIVKSDPEIGNALEAAKVPGKIRSRRGIAYISDDGTVKTKKVTDPDNGDNTGAPGAGQETDPENPSGDPANAPGGGSSSPGQGGDDDTAEQVGNDTIGDQLQSVSGTDYSTGVADNAVKVNVNAVDGFGYPVPPGWNDPETPPTAAEGKSFVNGDIHNTYYPTIDMIGDAILANDPFVISVDSYSVVNDTGVVSMAWGQFNYDQVITFVVTITNQSQTNRWAYRIDTPQGQSNEPFYHPSDGVCVMAWDDVTGKFKGHDLDNDCSATQKTGHTDVYLEQNGVRKKITRLANGGFKVTDVDASNVDDPNGYTRIYNAQGIMTDIYQNSVGVNVT